jgi:hypothetical protein
MLRAHGRNPHVRRRYLIEGLNSEDPDVSKKAIDETFFLKETLKEIKKCRSPDELSENV